MNIDTFVLSSDQLNLIAQIDEFKGAWQAIGQLTPDRLKGLRKVATIESVGSSTRIEGSSLTDGEVEELLANLDVRELASRDEEEVASYALAMEAIFESSEAIPLSENMIKQLHRMVLKYSTKDQRHLGDYKHVPGTIEAFDSEGKSLGVVFETTSPLETPQQMRELIEWTKGELELKRWHALIVIGVFVVRFLAIHPFQDGNGRLSRILSALLLMRAGYHYTQYYSLESIVEEHKDLYYQALRNTQVTLQQESPNYASWLDFFLQALKLQTSRLKKKVEHQRGVGIELPELSARILEAFRGHERLTMSQLIQLTGGKRPTVKYHVNKLKAAGLLQQHGQGKGTWYTA